MRRDGVTALQDDEGRQIAVSASKAVADPRAGTGMPHEGEAGVEGVVALGVFVDLGGHGADDGEIVGAPLLNLGKHRADFQAALAALFEVKRAPENLPVVIELGAFHFDWHRFAVHFAELGFGVEGIDMGDAARHVEEDDVLGFTILANNLGPGLFCHEAGVP